MLVDEALRQLDQVGIEPARQAAVRRDHHQQDALLRPHRQQRMRARIRIAGGAAAATFASIWRNRSSRRDAPRWRWSCARRSFAAETIFMALVICCVFLTERTRRRMSIRLGIYFALRLVLLHEARLEFLDAPRSSCAFRSSSRVFFSRIVGKDRRDARSRRTGTAPLRTPGI